MTGDDQPAPQNLVDLLGELVEPPEPAPISMVPQTAGWTVLAAMLALAALWLAWRGWQRWHANGYRRAALADLETAGDDPAAVADILRRTALAAWPRASVAALSGTDWLRFLDTTGGTTAFTEGPGAALAGTPYRAARVAVPGLGALATNWVRRHRVLPAPDASA